MIWKGYHSSKWKGGSVIKPFSKPENIYDQMVWTRRRLFPCFQFSFLAKRWWHHKIKNIWTVSTCVVLQLWKWIFNPHTNHRGSDNKSWFLTIIFWLSLHSVVRYNFHNVLVQDKSFEYFPSSGIKEVAYEKKKRKMYTWYMHLRNRMII